MQNQDLGDYVGVESCIDLKVDVFDNPSADDYSEISGEVMRHQPSRRRQRMRETATREYPPPIAWIGGDEHSHMPLVMKKYYTSDGRLVIKEEKAERQYQYFRAYRSDGRLVLNMVPYEESWGERPEDGCMENAGERIDGGDVGKDNPTVEEVFSECYKHTSVVGGVNLCGGFGVAVPLHT